MMRCECLVCRIVYIKEGDVCGISHGICSQDCGFVYRLWFFGRSKYTLTQFNALFKLALSQRGYGIH